MYFIYDSAVARGGADGSVPPTPGFSYHRSKSRHVLNAKNKISSPIRITQLSFPIPQFIFVRVLFNLFIFFVLPSQADAQKKQNSQKFTTEIVRKMLRYM